MKRIWSPWRIKYIQNSKLTDECPFCAALENPEPADHFLVHKGDKAFVILNLYPYTTGHLLILPVEHQEKMANLDPETRGEIMELINHALKVLGQIYHPEGYNVGLNMGEAAGAGIPKHLHWHIVPRWVGDTNYMTAVGEVRVLPETLEDTYLRIVSAW
jgi:ATP adenylyltransferase